MAFPGFENFFELHDPVANRPFRGAFGAHGLAVALSRAETPVTQPVHIGWAMGSAAPSPVIWTTSAGPLILHESVLDLLAHERVSGWSTYPVEVYAKSGEPVPGFAGLAITGRCGPVDLSRSAIELREYPGGWVPHFRGHYFVPDTWDGTDLFMEAPDQLGKTSTSRFLSPRGYSILKRARVRNLRFVRLTESLRATDVYTIGLQHLLPRNFQHRVAQAYTAAGVPRPSWI
jgi:hypothetical protein